MTTATRPRFRIVREKAGLGVPRSGFYLQVLRRGNWVTMYAKPVSAKQADAAVAEWRKQGFVVEDEREKA